MIEIREYQRADGTSPYAQWFAGLDATSAARVAVARERLGLGHVSQVKPVGHGVFEDRLHAGPGLRLYFGRDGEHIVILVGGGMKRRQDADIAVMKQHGADYRKRQAEQGAP